MAEWIVMPKLGLTMTEGIVTGWHKSEGDTVIKGEILFEVETDKITNECEAKMDGVIRKILVAEGEVEVLKPVAIIGDADEDISAMLAEAGLAPAAVSGTAAAAAPLGSGAAAAAAGSPGRRKASPWAKRVAADLEVDLAQVAGTGPLGRIVERDVRGYAEARAAAPKVKASPAATKIAAELGVDLAGIAKDGRIMKADVYEAAAVHSAAPAAGLTSGGQPAAATRKPMSAMRKVIAKRMLESKQTSPSVNYCMKIDTTALALFREQLKDVCKVTYTDLLVKIAAKALLEFPLMNASVEVQEIVLHHEAHIGVAVGLEDGLVVPVVKHADRKGLKEISQEVRTLAEKARNNGLTPDEMSGSTFTITNLGMYGMESFTPIINQPEVAILGVNTIVETPVVIDGQITVRPLMNLSLTADHRVIDGAVAAKFLQRLKQYAEKPGLLLL